MNLLIRRYGRLIDVSPDGIQPTPPHIVSQLAAQLSYQHRTFLYGHDRYEPDGSQRGNVMFQTRHMFQIEEGRFVTSYGFFRRVVALLQGAGASLSYVDMSPVPTDRPDRFAQDWDSVRRFVQFRHPVQEYCVAQIAANDQGQIHAPPGFGKSHLCEAVCHLFPNAKIHVVVRPVDVARRLYRQFSRHMPNVGIVGGGAAAIGERVTVFTAASLHHSDGDADFLLGDEGHLLLAEKSAEAIAEHYQHARIYLLTATPTGRADGTDARMEMISGPPIFQLGYQQAVECGLVVPIRVRWLHIGMERNPAAGKTGVPRERWGIWRNNTRNALIAADVRQNYTAEQQVLMLCSKVEHAINLWQHLPEFSLCHAEQDSDTIEHYKRNGYLPQGYEPIDAKKREAMRSAFEVGTLKKVIATDVWATGVDFPSLQVLYRVDARQSEIIDGQAPARVSRIDGDTKGFGEVVDCCDIFDPYFYKNSLARRRHYNVHGWTQVNWPARRGTRSEI